MNIAPTQSTASAARTLEGKVAIVTGSTSGIGLGIVRSLCPSARRQSSMASVNPMRSSNGIPRGQVIPDVLLAQQPNKRFASVEEIGAFAAFLASDAAASIAGAAPPVDGGWTAH